MRVHNNSQVADPADRAGGFHGCALRARTITDEREASLRRCKTGRFANHVIVADAVLPRVQIQEVFL